MNTFEFALFYAGWMVAGASPGPATLSIAGTSMKYGRKAGTIFSLGILGGSAALGLTAASGLSAVMLANAWVFGILRYIGAAYLFYLAAKAFRSAAQQQSEPLVKCHAGSAKQLFTRGLLIHLTNPKAILTWASIYAIILPAGAETGEIFRLFGVLFAGSIVIFLGYAQLFSSARIVRGYNHMRRGFEFIFGTFFSGAGLKLLTVDAG